MAVAIALTFGSFGDIVLVVQLAFLLSVWARKLWRWRDDYYRLLRETEYARRTKDLLPSGEALTRMGVAGFDIMEGVKQQLDLVLREAKELENAFEPLGVTTTNTGEVGFEERPGKKLLPGFVSAESTSTSSTSVIATITRKAKDKSRECLRMMKWVTGNHSAKAKEFGSELLISRYQILLMAYFHSSFSLLTSAPRICDSHLIKLIDAFGAIAYVPIQCCFPEEVFTNYLKHHFRSHPGETAVEMKCFVLSLTQNSAAVYGKNWNGHIRCGVETTMSIKILRVVSVGEVERERRRCPRCGMDNYSMDSSWCGFSNKERQWGFECQRCQALIQIPEPNSERV